MDGREDGVIISAPPQKGTERRNYPTEVNEVSQVDEGKIAAKRGQRFLFSLSLCRGKWLRSRSILLEDAEHSNAEMEGERCGGGGGMGGCTEINGIKW